MVIYNSFRDYLYNLHTTSSGEARRMWKASIKANWNYKCAYCGSGDELTIDHIIPQSLGGIDFSTNVVCCCRSCNISKNHRNWLEWYQEQPFFDKDKMYAIMEWMNPKKESTPFYRYKQRKTQVY